MYIIYSIFSFRFKGINNVIHVTDIFHIIFYFTHTKYKNKIRVLKFEYPNKNANMFISR